MSGFKGTKLGVFLGLGKRSAPDITEQFKAECERRGMKPSDGLATALHSQIKDWGLTPRVEENRKIIETMDASAAVVEMANCVNKMCMEMSKNNVQNAELIAKIAQTNMIDPLSADLDHINKERKEMLIILEEKAAKIKQLDEILEKRKILARSQGIDPDVPTPRLPVVDFRNPAPDHSQMSPEERQRLLEKMRQRKQ